MNIRYEILKFKVKFPALTFVLCSILLWICIYLDDEYLSIEVLGIIYGLISDYSIYIPAIILGCFFASYKKLWLAILFSFAVISLFTHGQISSWHQEIGYKANYTSLYFTRLTVYALIVNVVNGIRSLLILKAN